jgi:hypothetical protein
MKSVTRKTSKNAKILSPSVSRWLFFLSEVRAQNTPGYNHKIPPQIMTPDSVETRIGRLKFFDGFPDKETTQKAYASHRRT